MTMRTPHANAKKQINSKGPKHHRTTIVRTAVSVFVQGGHTRGGAWFPRLDFSSENTSVPMSVAGLAGSDPLLKGAI